MLVRSRVVILSVMLGVFIGFIAIAFLPSTTTYSVANEGDDGLSTLHKTLKAKTLYTLSELSSYDSKNILLVCARFKPVEDVNQIISFAESGGVVLIYGSPEHVVRVLEGLGIHASFRGYVRDAVFGVGDSDTVLVNTTYSSLVFRKPYTLDGGFGSVGTSMVAWSSLFSYVDVNENNLYDLNEPIGSFPLGLEVVSGEGKIFVLFTEYLLENSVLTHNLDFVKSLTEDRTLVVDQSEMRYYPVEVLRTQLMAREDLPVAYVVLSLLALLSVVAYLAVRK